MSPGAENESGDRSLAESLNLRAVRAAEPTAENTDKKRKNKRSKNKRRKNGQKARGKKNNKKNKNKNKRNNNKRNKNKGKKNRKSSRGQRLNRQGAAGNQTTEGSECLPKTCIATAVGYMKKNDMVQNFEAQKKRLERFVKQANSKANKSANFAPLIVKLTALGGGNSSNLLCNGNGTNSGAVLLKNLTAELGKCNASITEECSTKSVVQAAVLNETTTASLKACLSTMLAFKNKLAEAGNKTLTESAVCAMYLKPELKELADNVNKTCMPTKLLAKAAKANSGCKDAFKACKGRMEDVTAVQSLCSPANSADSLKAAIASGMKNKDAATKLDNKVATLLSGRRLQRSTKASCSDFAEKVSQASAKLEQTPLMASLAAELNTLASTTVAACDKAAKEKLTASKAKLVNGLAAIDKAIKEKKAALMQATGQVYVAAVSTSSATSGVTSGVTSSGTGATSG